MARRRGKTPKAPKREIHLGPALRALRWPNRYGKADMTQDEVAAHLGVSEGLICRWEQGNEFSHPNDEDIKKICSLFGVSREQLERMAREIAEWRKAVDGGKPARAA